MTFKRARTPPLSERRTLRYSEGASKPGRGCKSYELIALNAQNWTPAVKADWEKIKERMIQRIARRTASRGARRPR